VGRRRIGRKALTPAQKQRRYRAQQPGKLKRERRAAREAELAAATLQAWQPLGARLFRCSMSISHGGSSRIRASPASTAPATITIPQCRSRR